MAERTSHSNHHDDHHHGEDEGLFADAEDDINNFRQNNNNNNKDNTQFMQIVSSDGSAPRVPHETYIIQIPRDQIYRIPPPENAEYVQRQCNTVVKDKGGSRRCAFWFFSIFFGLAFLISVIVCVHKFTLSPKPPSFSIKHLVKQSSKSSSKKTPSPSPGFLVSMETTNPNKVNDLGYNQGSVKLSYKGKPIGNGHFPALGNQGPGVSDPVDINLVGSSKGGLPKDLDVPDNSKKSKSTKGNKTVNMNLLLNIPVRMKTWLWTKTVDFDVNCEFEADFMGDHFKVQSQKCDLAKA